MNFGNSELIHHQRLLEQKLLKPERQIPSHLPGFNAPTSGRYNAPNVRRAARSLNSTGLGGSETLAGTPFAIGSDHRLCGTASLCRSLDTDCAAGFALLGFTTRSALG